ncbi:MAG: mechanosensitive ion channel family protein [Acidiferrobacterales bacterium]|nr:mechanosensitive ion channel family protein [Acidiferrobacterales bacterium]
MQKLLTVWVNKIPTVANHSEPIATGLSVLLILIAALLSYFVMKRVIVYFINKLFSRTKSSIDDVFVKRRVFNRLAYIVPAWLIYKLLPTVLGNYPFLNSVLATLIAIYLVLAITMVVDALINSLLDIYRSFPISRRVPIQSFAQVAKLLVYFVAVITIVSLTLGESPLKLFAGLGAMTAILMLVFKDPILGFVAGVQLSYNKMVGIGDWVEIPQHNADGDILEIGLTTVKVQNFDNTITTVPTQSLINESFKNWRGMQESAGRRIKRAIYIDISSIRFCDQEALDRYAKVDHIKEYIESKKLEVEQHNQQNVVHTDLAINHRRLTNIGTFRAYVVAYLRNHPSINQNLTLLVRQLKPTESGLPLEIYAFSSEKNWIKYEAIQADIFDHLFAIAREFDLIVFQKPSGNDLQRLGLTNKLQ